MANTLDYYVEQLNKEGLLVTALIKRNEEVNHITFDSRNVTSSSLFICKGLHFKESFLDSALLDGATCYVSEQRYDTSSPKSFIIVNDIRKAISLITQCYYGNLSEKLKMVGITGTKGKSTTAYFTKSILDEIEIANRGKRIALCSGIRNYDGVNDEESQLTTPEILHLYEHINNAINSGLNYMVMEVSSQGLKYNRVDGINFEVACFTNIGEDHISPKEHVDFEDYLSSKISIFKQCKKACINLDSKYIERIMLAASDLPVVTYSLTNEKANITADNITSDNGKVSFDVIGRSIKNYKDFNEHIELASFGTVNVINALAAISIAVSLDVPMKYIKKGLSKSLVPGRMQVFRSKDGKKIGLVDYAHNQLSFEMLLSSIKEEFPDREIVMIFGSTGGKAFNRREALGTIAGKYCKHVVLTEDDGADEDVTSICLEIASYLGDNCTYEIIPDRPSAVRKGITYCSENTIVIAAGKAMESFQKRGGGSVKIESDVEVMSREFEEF